MKLLIAILLLASVHPSLEERYAESWGGQQGQQIKINEKTTLTTSINKLQSFNPVVVAPENMALTNVLLSICLPVDFKPENIDKEVWTLQEITDCSRYTTIFRNIQKGIGLNPRSMLFFRSQKIGNFKIKYYIASIQLKLYSSYFTVNVK